VDGRTDIMIDTRQPTKMDLNVYIHAGLTKIHVCKVGQSAIFPGIGQYKVN